MMTGTARWYESGERLLKLGGMQAKLLRASEATGRAAKSVTRDRQMPPWDDAVAFWPMY